MKHYFVLGYSENNKLISLTPDGFTELSLALEFLATVKKGYFAFVATRLI